MAEPACVATLARDLEAAEARCASLDRDIGTLTETDERRNALWLELESVLADRQRCLEALALASAATPAAAREKAAIARRLLHQHAATPAEDSGLLLRLAGSALDDLLAAPPLPASERSPSR